MEIQHPAVIDGDPIKLCSRDQQHSSANRLSPGKHASPAIHVDAAGLNPAFRIWMCASPESPGVDDACDCGPDCTDDCCATANSKA